jgi:drug/metabolite transporter (DMT)-like permease
LNALRRLLCSALAALSLASLPAVAEEKFIVVSSTTSTEQSGLFGHLLLLGAVFCEASYVVIGKRNEWENVKE